MKYFWKKDGSVAAYEDNGSQDHLIGDKAQLTDIELEEHLAPSPIPNCTKITKLQAVRYFQNNGVWSDIKTAITSDEDVSDRWDATTVLVIDDADVLALASVAESLTGKDVQTMFNEAREL